MCYILPNQHVFRNKFFLSMTKRPRGPEEMASWATFGPRAVVWRPWFRNVVPKLLLIEYHFGPRTVTTYNLVSRKLVWSNFIRSKVWKTRIDTNAIRTKCLWETIMVIFNNNQHGKYTKIQEFIKRTRKVKTITVNIFFVKLNRR